MWSTSLPTYAPSLAIPALSSALWCAICQRATPLKGPYRVLENDIRCQLLESDVIYLGCDWILFAGYAMRRDAVGGIFREDLSQRYLSQKIRIQLVDNKGQSISLNLSWRQTPLYVFYVYGRLVDLHSRAFCEDARVRGEDRRHFRLSAFTEDPAGGD